MNKTLIVLSFSLFVGFALVPLNASADDAGKGAYDTYCSTCHGATGGGDGAGGQALDPKPANFQDAKFWATRDDATVTKAIKEGGAAVGKSPLMIAWGTVLDDAKIAAVVAHLKTFKQ